MKKTFVVIGSVLMVALALAEVESGLQVGAGVPAYNPQHIAGPLKGTTQCFV